MTRRDQRTFALTSAAALVLLLAGTSSAQTNTIDPKASAPAANPATQAQRSTGVPQQDTLNRMNRRLAIKFNEHRLEDVMKFIAEATGADIEVFWIDDKNSVGFDKDTPITLNFE